MIGVSTLGGVGFGVLIVLAVGLLVGLPGYGFYRAVRDNRERYTELSRRDRHYNAYVHRWMDRRRMRP